MKAVTDARTFFTSMKRSSEARSLAGMVSSEIQRDSAGISVSSSSEKHTGLMSPCRVFSKP